MTHHPGQRTKKQHGGGKPQLKKRIIKALTSIIKAMFQRLIAIPQEEYIQLKSLTTEPEP